MPTTPPTITASPPVPQRGVKATFSNHVDAFVTWMSAGVSQFGAVAINCYNNAVEAFSSATAAATSAGNAATSEASALASANAAAGSVTAAAAINGATAWTSGSTYQQFAVAVSRLNFKTYRKTTTAGANTGGATDPASDATNWQVVGPAVPRLPRTANTMLAANDIGSFVDITSGSFTQTFDTPANLAPGWYAYVKNSGTGTVTIPASDGRTNWAMYPGEVRLFQGDGAMLRSVVLAQFCLSSVNSGTFIKPPGYKRFEGEMWAGGSSGGRFTGTGVGVFGGHGGGHVAFSFPETELGTTEAWVVGAGGAPQTADNSQWGLPGGNSTFKGLTAYGGGAGSGAAGGTAFYPASGIGGLNTSLAVHQGATSSPTGGTSTVYGGDAGAAVNEQDATVKTTATKFGGSGGATDGAAGQVPGGGGAATKGAASGAGAGGKFTIWGVA